VIGIANVRLKHQRDLAEMRRLEAVANLRKAREAVDRMLTRVSEERLKSIPQVEPIQRALLEDALEFYRDLARQSHDDPEILVETSRAYRRLGQNYRFFGRIDESKSCFLEALALQDKLAVSYPATAVYRAELAKTHIELVGLWGSLDRTAEALEAARISAALIDELIRESPESRDYTVLKANGIHARAMILQDMDQIDAAKADYLKVIELCENLTQRFPSAFEHKAKATIARHNLAIMIEDVGEFGESERIHRVNLKFWEDLAASEPSNPDYRSKTALTLESLAALLEKTKRSTEDVLRRAAHLRSLLTKDFPNTPYHFSKLAGSLNGLARVATARGDLTEARRLLEESLAARRAALALSPGYTEFVQAVATCSNELVESLIRLKDHQAATKLLAEQISLAPGSGEASFRAGSVLARCATLAAADRGLPEARRSELASTYAERAVAMLREGLQKGHGDFDALRNDRSFDSLRARPDFASLLAGPVKPPVDLKR
jgi:tetratricopeptide (TPR) repeat protein